MATHSPRAARSPACRAKATPFLAQRTTRAPWASATSRVRSLEALSTTMTSRGFKVWSATAFRAPGR
jgi:hypothetical protein